MRVYQIGADITFVGFDGSHAQYARQLRDFKARPDSVLGIWKGIRYRLQSFENFHDPSVHTKAQSKALYARGLADCISGLETAYNERAVEALSPFFLPKGEFLPITVVGDRRPYFHYHCMNVVDALDVDASDMSEDVPNMPNIYGHVFKPGKLRGQHAIRLSVDPIRCRLYVTDRVVAAVEIAGLLGFQFREVWNDVDGPVSPDRASGKSTKSKKSNKGK